MGGDARMTDRLVVHATTLEDFRWNARTEWGSLDRFEDRILRGQETNENMLRGSAVHAVLEDPKPYRRTLYHPEHGHNDLCLVWEDPEGSSFSLTFWAESILGLRSEIGSALHEVRACLDVGTLRISCRADGLNGSRVDEIKCPTRAPEADNFYDSYQWRMYAAAFGATSVRYHIVQLSVPRGRKAAPIATVAEYTTLDFPAYAGLERDIGDLAFEFQEFIARRSLEAYFREAEEEDELPWARRSSH
jgi:hypothetical protein